MTAPLRIHQEIQIEGIVQGVGFRPYVVRLATKYTQYGWVKNTASGVFISIEGEEQAQQQFIDALQTQLPPVAQISALTLTQQPSANFTHFAILPSIHDTNLSIFSLPDIATCGDCINDIFNPNSRYFRYPFTSCCHCGPRYTITSRQPFDRKNTSMAEFTLCKHCQHEYESMANRRFHAQTMGCRECGVQLSFSTSQGDVLAQVNDALEQAITQLRAGNIIAVKGIGGYQLLVDATNQVAVERLRERKKRLMKPFAIMVKNMAAAQTLCAINDIEKEALTSYASPIVLLQSHQCNKLANAVSPQLSTLGVMLPYSPLHHLLLNDIDFPLVVTSGNRQNEPICIDDAQAFTILHGIADYFLTHNRPILRALDDSVVRVINHKITVLRRARGFAPLPIKLPIVDNANNISTLAVGGHLKNTFALSQGNYAVLSQHLGDLETQETQIHVEKTVDEMQTFYGITPKRIMHDTHLDYASSQLVSRPLEKHAIQHHYAHALSCMAENGLTAPALAIVWDGAGLGLDNTLWGGEFLRIHEKGFSRFAHFRTFPLIGGHKAMEEPRRAALGLLFELYGDLAFERMNLPFSAHEQALMKMALNNQLNCPRTSSVGRLFDAVSSLLGLCHLNTYEGQAAMQLENCAILINKTHCYEFNIQKKIPAVIDWQPMIEQILYDTLHHPPAYCATILHNTLAKVCINIAQLSNEKTVVLSGGCFQNAQLTQRVVDQLNAAGFDVHCHSQVPPNDGGLALGQLYAGHFL
jgi:hydrogenase maturation protein HypF